MTVSSEISRWAYNGDGSTDTFAYNTKIFAKTDLLVYVDGTLKTVDTHYTVSGVGESAGGNVVFTAGNEPASGTNNVIIEKAIPNTQGASLPLGGKFPSTTVENALDRLTMLVQQVNKKVVRSLRQMTADADDIGQLPLKADRLGKFLSFNATTGDPEATGAANIADATEGEGIDITGGVVSLDLPGLTAETTVADGDLFPFIDISESNAQRKATRANILNGASGANLTGLRKQGLETIWVPAAAMTPTVSNGCASLTKVETTAGRPDMVVLDFDASADEHAQFSVAFPKSWDEGTVTFRVFHTTTATDTDGVAWGLQGVACSDGDTIDVAYGTAVVVTDAYQSTAEDLYVTAVSSAVTIAGTPAAGDAVFFRIFRDVSDAADTAAEDARLIGVQILFTTNAADDT